LSFLKGIKKKDNKGHGKSGSDPIVTNQMSTMHSESNDRLDPNAFTEVDPHAGQTKTSTQKKLKMTFANGFQKQVKQVKDVLPPDNNPLRLYPGPEQPWNVSGSDKVANATPAVAPLKPPVTSARGANPTLKNMAGPKRVSANVTPYGLSGGAQGSNGVRTSMPFTHSFGKFGRKPRQAIQSFTRAKRGF
jgi:hypothetical protein